MVHKLINISKIIVCSPYASSWYTDMFNIHLQEAFDQLGTSVVNVMVMTLGEIEFMDNFVALDLKPFQADVYILLVIFLFIMPIVLMNLMVNTFLYHFGYYLHGRF